MLLTVLNFLIPILQVFYVNFARSSASEGMGNIFLDLLQSVEMFDMFND